MATHIMSPGLVPCQNYFKIKVFEIFLKICLPADQLFVIRKAEHVILWYGNIKYTIQTTNIM